MMRFSFLILTFYFLNAEAQSSHQRAKISNVFSEWDNPSVPGVAVAVVRDGNLIYQQGFGMSNLKKNVAIDSLTEFWIASVTKQFTAFGIYLLEASGKLKLNNSVRMYLPELPELFEPITIEQLVHHTSGIRDGFVLTALSKKTEEEYTNENVLKYLMLQKELNSKPGATHEYNNSGYVLLAQVIERVTKTTYPEFMKAELFIPLGMNNTFVSGKYPTSKKIAEGYHSKDYSNKAGSFEEGHFMGDTFGSTGIITTSSDMAKWATFLQNSGYNSVLAKAKKRLLATGTLSSGDRIGYAGGLERFQYKGKIVFEHFGADEGFKANMLFFPQQKLSIIGLTNNTTNYGLSDKLYVIADILLKEDFNPSSVNPSDKDLIWEQAYFTALPSPAYRLVKYSSRFAKVADVPGGSEAYYYNINDTFRTHEPIARSLMQISKEEINILDPYNHQHRTLHAIDVSPRTDDYQSFIGKYSSDEIQTNYQIILNQGQLYFEYVPGVQLKLNRVIDNYFLFHFYGANYIEFSGNEFFLSREGIQKLRFRKL